MTPYQRAIEWCKTNVPDDHMSLSEVIELHLKNGGSLVSTPEVFCLWRPVGYSWPEHRILNPLDIYAPEWAFTAHVWLCAGDVREALKHVPEGYRYVSMHRRGKRIVMPLRRLLGRFAQLPNR